MEDNNVNEEIEEVINDGEEIEFLDPVQPIEIEEGMPDDVKEAILRFNKRTSALREVTTSNIDSSLDNHEDDDEEYDEEIEEENITNDVNIIEEDDSEELGDLF